MAAVRGFNTTWGPILRSARGHSRLVPKRPQIFFPAAPSCAPSTAFPHPVRSIPAVPKLDYYRKLMFRSPNLNGERARSRLSNPMRILVIEDERKVAEMVGRGLRTERYAVDIAGTGNAGCEMASATAYDLLILDLGLPDMDGRELIQRLRGQESAVPILVLTARDSTASKVENFEAGADDYLTKPFAFEELSVRVKALLRRGPINKVQVRCVADLEIDLLHQLVKRAGRRIELTPKEYALLEYLAANAQRVVSRTMIMEHVWDQSFEGLTNIVDVYVRHLRAKIDDPFPLKLIRTVRGIGYRLAEEAPA